MSPLTKLPAVFRDKLVQSRFFTISATLHLILLALLGTTIYYRVAPPPEKGDFRSEDGIVQLTPKAPEPPREPTTPAIPKMDITKVNLGSQPTGAPNIDLIKSSLPADNSVPDVGVASKVPIEITVGQGPSITSIMKPGELSRGDLDRIGKFTDHRVPGAKTEFEFTAFLGRYQGGNWNSTVRITNGEITGGSLPNLLYCTSKWSKDKIKTNERNVKALDLASDELLTARPPFIFLTGTRDFVLSDKEIENLQRYIRCGGAVWGDSSVPGRRSAFDVAFCREMKRVMGDSAGQFEALPANHPIFAQGYFKKPAALPAGINQYRDPVEVLKWGGEMAIIHTINDYGDMWQIGLDKNAQIDLSRNARGEYVAMNATLWDQRGLYVRNIEQPAVEDAYKFGINMIFHLITRWENRTASVGTL